MPGKERGYFSVAHVMPRGGAAVNNLMNLDEHLARLNRIGIALSGERDLTRLLTTILQEARDFTHAEGGTLYSVEGEKLRFLATQNDTLDRRGDGTDYSSHATGQC